MLERAEVRVARAEHVELALAARSSRAGAGADGRLVDVVVCELGVAARAPHVAVALAAHVRRRVRVQARLLLLVLLATARTNRHAPVRCSGAPRSLLTVAAPVVQYSSSESASEHYTLNSTYS